ncbi:50S ribosomal protein L24 [bacterium]|nr:50S ribosomal protein L24 [bacterium]
MKVKTSDKVLVITGKDRNKTGKITRVINKLNKVVVEKVNMRTKHIKKTQTAPGSKIQFEAAINASNVQVICPNCQKATRVGYKKLESGKKQRMCKKCGESLDKISTIK